jgi:CheY-like chemotaxis protein
MKCDLREINHQLRTPIAGILGIVKILEHEKLSTHQLGFIKDIEHCSQELLASIETLTAKFNKNILPRGLNILLVEDEPILQKATRFFLESKGHTVTLAENGKIALEKFDNSYDVIFMDIRMPEMDGMQATKAIRELEAGKSCIPIIAATAEGIDIREECLDAGMDGFMLKPLNMDAVEQLLEKIKSKK